MTEKTTSEAWQRFLSSSYELDKVRGELISTCGESIVDVIRSALDKPSERNAALNVLWYISPELCQRLLPDLLRIASFQHGAIRSVRAHIASLSRTWLLANIEGFAEPVLSAATDDEPYRRLLELYREIDRDLMLRLARRAQSHPNPHIREAGTDFLGTPE